MVPWLPEKKLYLYTICFCETDRLISVLRNIHQRIWIETREYLKLYSCKVGLNTALQSTPTSADWEKGRKKDKFHPRTGHEGPEGEWTYNSTLSLTLAVDGMGGQSHAPAALPPGKRPGTHFVGC